MAFHSSSVKPQAPEYLLIHLKANLIHFHSFFNPNQSLHPSAQYKPQSHSLKKPFLHSATGVFPNIMHRHTRTYLFIVDKHMIQSQRNKQTHFPPVILLCVGRIYFKAADNDFSPVKIEKGNWMNHRRRET